MDNNIVNKAADNIRILALSMVEKAGSGHPGGAMGGADFINILYSEFLNFDPNDMNWPFRDRFFLDPGHMSPMIYSMLSMFGKYSTDDLKNFRQWQSVTPGHPELDVNRGIENTSGPLGQGHTNAVGAAIAERFLAARFGDWMSHKIYAFISDGGIQEEVSQGAGRIAGYLGLSNLIMFYDANKVQLSTMVDQVTMEDTAKKYEAWGWRVITINGNDPDEIRGALLKANQEKEKPFLIIGETIMGKGALTENGENFEGQVSTHGQPLSKAGGSVEKTILNLGGDPNDPFAVFPEVERYYKEVIERKKKVIAARKKQYTEWQVNYPEKAAKLRSVIARETPELNIDSIVLKENGATRAASGTVLGSLSGNVENMIVISADLSNSDKTEGFLKNTKPIAPGDFQGAFLHAGVSELTMAAIANGMALHNVIPVCGTFFAFSDFMKPAIRLAALMELPVIYVWTHDSFRVGEDGPTHQPIEQEAQIRLLEKLKNHKKRNSMLVLRPADGAETLIAWKMALDNHFTPTGLILSRQNIKDLPAGSIDERLQMAKNSEKGAYVVKNTIEKPDVILVASGSEVSTLIDAANILKEQDKINARVVSAISEGVFLKQEDSYRKEIIPADIPVLGLTAGLPVTMVGLVGCNGKVLGVDHFGYSAPYQVLDEEFGFSGEQVRIKILQFLGKHD